MQARAALIGVILGSTVAGTAAAQPLSVDYAMTFAGLPIGSAKLAITPNGASTSIAVSGSAGGPLEIGRMSATATIAPGRVQASSQSGAGKDATSATLTSVGTPQNSTFSLSNVSGRGPGSLSMTIQSNRVAALDNKLPDNPKAVRAPVTEAHRAGVVDPLMLLAQVVAPGGAMRPEAVCGRTHRVFTGVARFDMAGTPPVDGPAAKGMPPGWRAVACRVTTTPIAGHRIDKGQKAEPRTASIVFAVNGERAALWSLTVPVMIGSFALVAREIR